MMMTLGGAVCRNETDNTSFKNVAAPKRAVDFETVARVSSRSDRCFIHAVIQVHNKILPSLGESLLHARDTFQTTSLCDVSMQELSVRWHWACPLWNTEDAAHAVAHACGAACTSKGAAVRCGEGVP